MMRVWRQSVDEDIISLLYVLHQTVVRLFCLVKF